mmetsp:Transcript_112952/g.364655  ORF Transcript_112952/g.364655 Transcript_112952/m.364655 type:complete len:737 (-) Transcript_112952:280-2490(-)
MDRDATLAAVPLRRLLERTRVAGPEEAEPPRLRLAESTVPAAAAAVTATMAVEGPPAPPGPPRWRSASALAELPEQPRAARECTAPCAEGGDATPPSASPLVLELAVGERVAYYSETHGAWMEATIERLNVVDGTLVSCDLNIKRGAQASKIARLPEASEAPAAWRPTAPTAAHCAEAAVTPSSSPNAAGLPAPHGHPAEPEQGAVALAPESNRAASAAPPRGPRAPEPVPSFAVGERVAYWSDTHQMWMGATVEKVNAGGASYDLDVKRGAQAWKMRSTQGSSSTPPEPAAPAVLAAPAQVPVTVMRTTLRDAVEVAEVDYARGDTPPRGTPPPRGTVWETGRSLPVPDAIVAGGDGTEREDLPSSRPHLSATAHPLGGGSRGGATAVSRTLAPADGAAQNPAVSAAVRSQAAPAARAAAITPGPVAAAGAAVARPAIFMGTGTEGRRRAAAATELSQATTTAPVSRGPPCSTELRSGNGGLEAGELPMGAGPFDPSSEATMARLSQRLGLSEPTVEEMQGFRGGLNEGVWFLGGSIGAAAGGGHEEFVLKLVRCCRIASNILTEAENCLKIYREHPAVARDPTLAFPLKIFSCVDSAGTKRHDLLVMRKVRGERFAELIARKWYGNQVAQLLQTMERLGACLGEFHSRYKVQHGDFQPSNIFYDEETEAVALIDVGGMGVPTTESDVEHFSRALRLLSDVYGARLASDGLRHFERGYARTAPASMPRPGLCIPA